LKGRYTTVKAAEEVYKLTLSDCLDELTTAGPKPPKQTPGNTTKNPTATPTDSFVDVGECAFTSMNPEQVLEFLSSLDDEKLKYIAKCLLLKACFERWRRH